jgi:hypothetical protein
MTFVTITRSLLIARPRSCLFIRSSKFAIRLVLSTSSTIYLRFATLFNQITLFTLNTLSTLIILFHVSKPKSKLNSKDHLSLFTQVLYARLEFVAAPFICFISQLRQIIILFLVPIVNLIEQITDICLTSIE